jgi:murein DD-endopeptidase MepM/ murein hydrolase activator NlpD
MSRPSVSALSSARSVSVRPGDTVYAISRRTGVPVRAIIVANQLTPPFILQPGQTLTLPAQRTHRVAPGETLFSLSRRYGPSPGAIANANGLTPPYVIKVGEPLVIPTDSGQAPPVMAVASGPLPDPDDRAALAAPPVSRQTGAPTPLVGPTTSSRQPAAPQPPVQAPAPAPASAPSPSPAQTAASSSLPPPPPMPSVSVARGAVSAPTPPPRAGSRFLWPVEGTVIAGFGPGSGGLHNDGINIAAPRGTPIKAAENGVVVYAGNEILGFGNLVLLRHDGGWMTAYAHADTLSVRRGQTVHRGAVIATVGQTGSVDRPQLHFEVRKSARPVDPRGHMMPPGGA